MQRIALLLLAGFLSVPASGAVRFADWSGDRLEVLLAQAAAANQLVMIVITQPDWCPGCIELDRKLLRNPDADEVAALTREWLVLEMMGYDEPDASVIAGHGLGFLGTPTTLLLSPRAGEQRLGEARQVAAIVGFPDDYLQQLERAAAGHDAIAEAQARLRDNNDVAALRALAWAYLAAGDAGAARRVLRSLLLRPELDAAERQSIALQAILQPTQRIENDHRRTLVELAEWIEAYPDGRHDLDYIYARAFALLSLGELEAATAWIGAKYLVSDDPDTVASYLYLAFRDPSGQLLADAEPRARRAIQEFPEQAARFHAAHGRLLRRQGRLAEAEQAFATAVELAGEDHPSHDTYLGQLEFVREQRVAATD